jgi:phage terminase large subunit
MYLTCNPGGVGHAWVKRLFIDRDYHRYPDDPERDEHAENYNFIFATVEDNKWLLESSPLYLKNLASMPEDLRRAYRYGDWDAIGGNFFPEFRENKHTTRPFRIPDHWPRFRSFDYGLDLFVCLWWAIDEDGRAWCYRSYEHEKLIVQEAAKAILDNTLPHEKIIATYAPPDMWNRQKDTGRTMAEIFMLNGVNVVKTDNNRVQGHMIMKDMMSPIPLHDAFVKSMYKGKPPEKLPGFIVFNTCDKLISDIKSIQADGKNPNDCDKEPHDITHTVDAARYFLGTRTLKAEVQLPMEEEEDEGQRVESYEEFMCGTGDGNYLV